MLQHSAFDFDDGDIPAASYNLTNKQYVEKICKDRGARNYEWVDISAMLRSGVTVEQLAETYHRVTDKSRDTPPALFPKSLCQNAGPYSLFLPWGVMRVCFLCSLLD
jgi:hypothetical protein